MLIRLLAGLCLVGLGLWVWSMWGARQIALDHPPIGSFVKVGGVNLHYVDTGPPDAPALILLHGANSNLRDFSSTLQPALADRYRVLAFDRPGYGHSEAVSSESWLDPSEQVGLILQAARMLRVKRPVLLGHSWAGSMVMAALTEHPDQVSGGVLLSGAAGHWAGSVGWTYDVADLPVIGTAFAHLIVYPVGQYLLRDSIGVVFAPNKVPAGYIDRIAAPLALRAGHFLHNARDMRELSPYLQRLSPRYGKIDLPLLAIHGQEDTLVPFWNHAQRLQPVIPHMQVQLMEGIGHVPHHVDTDRVADRVHRFLQSPRVLARIEG